MTQSVTISITSQAENGQPETVQVTVSNLHIVKKRTQKGEFHP